MFKLKKTLTRESCHWPHLQMECERRALANQKLSISSGVSDWPVGVPQVRGDWWSALTAEFEYISVTVSELHR